MNPLYLSSNEKYYSFVWSVKTKHRAADKRIFGKKISIEIFFNNDMPLLLDNFRVLLPQDMWFMNDGALSHFGVIAAKVVVDLSDVHLDYQI